MKKEQSINKTNNNITNYIGIIILIIAVVCVIFAINNVNYFQIDFSGHIASSSMFERYGIHGRNPDRFYGLINNLFYPPLENVLVFIIHHISSLDYFQSFMVYVCMLIFGYWFGVYRLIKKSKHWSISLFMFLGLAIYFFLDKSPNITYFQGGGFLDLMFTGLTTQSLGIIFLLFFIGEFLSKSPKSYILGILAALGFLSHIIIGPVMFLIWFIYILYTGQKKEHIYYFLLAIGGTSIFWLPFMIYGSVSVPSLIIFSPPILLLIVAIVFLILSYKKRFISPMILLGVSIMIISPNYIATRFNTLTGISLPLPFFHYYRFATISLLIGVIGIIWFFNNLYEESTIPQNKQKNIMQGTIVMAIMIIGILIHFGVLGLGTMKDILAGNGEGSKITEIDKIQKNYELLNNGKKILSIDIYRPIGFGIDSYFQYKTDGLPFVKGLFWESSNGNLLLSSYLATLLSPKDVVLNYFVMTPLDNTGYANLRDGFIKQYDIGRIITAPEKNIYYMTGSIKKRLFNIFTNGTPSNNFIARDSVLIEGIPYTIYEISPRKGKDNTDPFVRPFTKDTQPIILSDNFYYSHEILYLYKTEFTKADKKDFVFFHEGKSPTFVPFWSGTKGPEYFSTKEGSYTIDLGTFNQSVVVRIPDLPGRRVKGLSGQKIDITNGVFEKIISGSGKVILSYNRTNRMILSYILSGLSIIGFVYLLIKKKV